MSDQKYSDPVAQLLTLGEPVDLTWLEYETQGIHAEHIPELIRLVEDHALRWESPEDESAIYAPVHAWRALGHAGGGFAKPNANERRFRRSLYVAADMKAGAEFTPENLRIVRPGLGLEPRHYESLLGKRVCRDVQRGTPVTWDLLG